MNLNGDFEVPGGEEGQGHDVIAFPEQEKTSDIDAMAALDDGLKTDLTESEVFPDPGNIRFQIDRSVDNPTEDAVLIEMPEVAEDLQGIKALEDAFQDLEYVCDDIAQMGGMNQSIATEADKCIPGFLSEERPLGYYTKAPSATNLKYALEAIDVKKAGIISAIIAAVLAAFYKIYDWFKKRKEANLKKEMDELNEGLKEISGKFEKADKGVTGGISNLMKDVAENGGRHTKKLLDDIDGVTHDMLLSSKSILSEKVSSLFRDNGGIRGFKTLIMDLETALDSIAATAKKQIGSYMQVDAVEADIQVNKLLQGKHPATDEVLGTLKYEGKMLPVAEIAMDLNSTITRLSEQRQKAGDFGRLIRGITALLNSQSVKEFQELNELYTIALGQLGPKLEEIKKIVESGKVETESTVRESPNYRGKKQIVDAVRRLNYLILSLGRIVNFCTIVLVNRPTKTLKELQAAHEEARAYLKKLKREYEQNGRDKTHADEIARIEEFLKAFS